MKRYCYLGLTVLLICNACSAVAQLNKPVVDSAAFDQWSSLLGTGDVSADGKYASYVQKSGNKNITIIKSLTGKWQKKLLSADGFKFLADDKQAIYQSKDTVYFIRLGTDKMNFIAGVQSVELVSSHNKEWILYKSKKAGAGTDLHILNTSIYTNICINNTNDYYFFENSATLLLIKPEMQAGKIISNSIYWYDLIHNHTTLAFSIEGTMPPLLTCGVADAFCYPEQDSSGHTSALLFYKKDMPGPTNLVDNSFISKMDSGFSLVDWDRSAPVFMKDGRHICFQVKKKNPKTAATHESKVTIWRYNERLLPTEQRLGMGTRNEFRWSVSTKDGRLVPLENEEAGLFSFPQECSNYLVSRKIKFDGNTFWQKGALNAVKMISVNTGKQTIIDDGITYNSSYYLSPEEKYIVYYDRLQRSYFCFDVETGQKRNLSAGVNKKWTSEMNFLWAPNFVDEIGIAGWHPNDEAVLIYSDYDIWKFDTKGIKPPVNITNGFGERHHIRFRIAGEISQSQGKPILNDNQNLLLYAFDSATKRSGFYSKRMNANADPILLNMDNYAYWRMGNDDFTLEKAKNTNQWIVRRENASFAPNLFSTADFKNFSPLSDVRPEKNYIWLTNKLVTWKLPNGQYNQGILYKPDNFDSSKKYPVIFDYYEERSDELNEFIEPRYAIDRINIPYFVSHGYLVFVPDIHYTIGCVTENALQTVVSAAKYLSGYPWVDCAKMGLQGHSFGGQETNDIITHSTLFAAACEAAGPTDAISGYGGLHGNGPNLYSYSRNEAFEIGQERMGGSLAEIPEVYIKESPVFNTAKVTTPLLMMHNQNDSRVPWSQAVEFFTGLKRMGKRVWMLEYEGGGHSINGPKAKDYTIRMLQFFDHYLKGAPIPKWMLEDGGLSYDLDKTAPEPEPKEVLYKGIYQKVLPANVKQAQ